MTELCIPPGDLAKRDGCHYLTWHSIEEMHFWDAGSKVWYHHGPIKPGLMTSKGFRYLGPVPTHADLVALVETAKEWFSCTKPDPEEWISVSGYKEALETYASLRAALAPFDQSLKPSSTGENDE